MSVADGWGIVKYNGYFTKLERFYVGMRAVDFRHPLDFVLLSTMKPWGKILVVRETYLNQKKKKRQKLMFCNSLDIAKTKVSKLFCVFVWLDSFLKEGKCVASI